LANVEIGGEEWSKVETETREIDFHKIKESGLTDVYWEL